MRRHLHERKSDGPHSPQLETFYMITYIARKTYEKLLNFLGLLKGSKNPFPLVGAQPSVYDKGHDVFHWADVPLADGHIRVSFCFQ